jgi:menaquinone-specific isochorismate synthase
MPVTPYRTNLLQDRKELYQLLTTCQQRAIEKDCPQIISISQEIEPLDPLAVLQAIAKPNNLQFYLENRTKNEAIAAIDTTDCIQLEGVNRFKESQNFIQNCLKNSCLAGDLNQPLSGIHFFCTFTFFDKNIKRDSPFPAATIFLPRWQVAKCKNRCVLVANIKINSKIDLEFIIESLCNQSALINGFNRRLTNITENTRNYRITQDSNNGNLFKFSVSSALNLIQANQLRKIVLASAIDVVSPTPFNLVNSLDNLRKRYPGCNVFSTSNGQGQNFIGASPERLISVRNHNLETDTLAGSAPRGKTTTEDAAFAYRLLSSEKERREHRFVLDFIAERLTELGLMPQMLPIPQLLKLSNIQHLWTPIKAQLPVDLHPLEIVAKLHPTPAVAGVPTKIAEEQILALETFDRSLYAAPLGWVDYQGNCEFIVGIRPALIDTEKPSRHTCRTNLQAYPNAYRARFYAGAGIVAGSDPNKELAEVQLKLQALLKALL